MTVSWLRVWTSRCAIKTHTDLVTVGDYVQLTPGPAKRKAVIFDDGMHSVGHAMKRYKSNKASTLGDTNWLVDTTHKPFARAGTAATWPIHATSSATRNVGNTTSHIECLVSETLETWPR